jgi:hypothetical protein
VRVACATALRLFEPLHVRRLHRAELALGVLAPERGGK